MIGHFPQKSLTISGFFAGNDLQLKASSWSAPYRKGCVAFPQKVKIDLLTYGVETILYIAQSIFIINSYTNAFVASET